jgi:hypothetical protein
MTMIVIGMERKKITMARLLVITGRIQLEEWIHLLQLLFGRHHLVSYNERGDLGVLEEDRER